MSIILGAFGAASRTTQIERLSAHISVLEVCWRLDVHNSCLDAVSTHDFVALIENEDDVSDFIELRRIYGILAYKRTGIDELRIRTFDSEGTSYSLLRFGRDGF